MDSSRTAFMRDLEERFVRATGLPDRSRYKIFYGPVHEAPVLVLGINPAGDPARTSPDGRTHHDGRIASASASFHENGEHDVLDCDWQENRGLRALLGPLVGGDPEAIRSRVVKTNMAFHRAARKSQIDAVSAMDACAPFLREILDVVRPSLVVLIGVALHDFTSRFCLRSDVVAPPERDPGVKQVVFAAARADLRSCHAPALIVQVAHASRFAWTYERYGVAERIAALRD